MDAWAQAHQETPFDQDGAWARTASVDETLLQKLMQDPYFQKPPPKSTGKEYFNLDWLQHKLDGLTHPPSPPVVQRTLCELTTRTIAQALEGLEPSVDRVLLCGGGVHNDLLRESLETALSPTPVKRTDDYGLDADHVESCAFAWLAMRTMKGLAGNLPSV